MATINRVPRTSGYAYKTCIRLRGIKPFSRTFRLRTDAKAWAERMERNIDEARAHGNDRAGTMTLNGRSGRARRKIITIARVIPPHAAG